MIDLILNRIVSFLLACLLMAGQALAYISIDQCCCGSKANSEVDTATDQSSQHSEHQKAAEHRCSDQAQGQTKESKKSCCDSQQVLTCCCGSQKLGFRIDATLIEIPQATVTALVHHSVIEQLGDFSMISLWDKSPATPPPRV